MACGGKKSGSSKKGKGRKEIIEKIMDSEETLKYL